MSVNGITNSTSATYEAYAASEKKAKENKKAATDSTAKAEKSASTDQAATYEASKEAKAAKNTTTKKPNTELINKLKADMDAHTSQLQNIVSQLISKQGGTYGTANDMWSFLAGGKFTVDAATKAQAQADIAEDGYWGVEATSNRIVDFAKALAGDDPKMVEKMRNAFKKGFDQATKTWGGKLPDISQQTYTAVMDKLDAWAKTGEDAATDSEKTESEE